MTMYPFSFVKPQNIQRTDELQEEEDTDSCYFTEEMKQILQNYGDALEPNQSVNPETIEYLEKILNAFVTKVASKAMKYA